ncbi:MAG: carbohydrate ABC transporter permease [Clostridiales Family XIII bacterium]|nr:carbohydrate ABC transporter permease [Clostridiales Family XIII bacterium]
MKRFTVKAGGLLGAGALWLSVFFLFVCIVGLMLWMGISSFKTPVEIFSDIWGLPENWLVSNYVTAWERGISRYFLNSLLVTAGTVILVLGSCTLFAYAVTAYRLKLRTLFFLIAMSGMLFSPIVGIFPLFQEIQALGLYNKRLALVLVYAAYQFSISFLLIYSAFKEVDKAYLDSARIDGCGDLRVLFSIYIPMNKPILITAAVLSGFYAWNEFTFALIFVKTDVLKTIPVGLLAFQGEMHAEWGILLAGLTLSALPIIVFFIFAQKYFVAGLSSGGVKG